MTAKRKTTKVVAEEPTPTKDPAISSLVRGPDFFWAGKPVYRCKKGCEDRYERVDNLDAVLEHERTFHEVKVESGLLGADGRPLS